MRAWSRFFGRRQRENDLDEEIRAHLTLAARDRVERGETPEDAEYSARHEFGNEALIKDATRDTWGWGAIELFGQDVRYGSRLMKRSPGFSLVAVLTLALGIGANSTVFSWIDAILLNPLPGVTDAGRIVALAPRGNPLGSISYPDLADLGQRNAVLSGLSAFALAQMSLGGTGKPERVWGILASANYFDVLGVPLLLGRGFSPDEDQLPNAAPVAVIGYGLWQRRFGGDSGILGQSVRLNSHVYTIVGIAPRGFRGSYPGLAFDIWIPLMMAPQVLSWNDVLEGRAFGRFAAMGRLQSNVNRTTAQANLNTIMDQIIRQYPESHKGWSGLSVDPLWRAGSNSFLAPVLLMLMIVAGLVLLLACANVANLLLARAVERC